MFTIEFKCTVQLKNFFCNVLFILKTKINPGDVGVYSKKVFDYAIERKIISVAHQIFTHKTFDKTMLTKFSNEDQKVFEDFKTQLLKDDPRRGDLPF